MNGPDPRLDWVLTKAKQAIARGVDDASVRAFIKQETKGLVGDYDALVNLVNDQNRVQVGKAEGIARAVHQGLTLGFGDELAGVIDALSGGDYKTARDAERAAKASFEHSNPKTAFAAELAGGILPSLAAPGAGMLKGAWYSPGIAREVLHGAAVGGGYGLLGGAGYSEADDAKGVAADALTGLAAGTGLGAAAPPVAGMLGWGAGKIGDVLRDTFAPGKGVAARAAARLQRAWSEMPSMRDNPTKALQRAGELERYAGPDAMAADLSPRAADELRAGTNLGGGARDEALARLEQRNENALSRIKPELERTTGTPRVNTRVVQRLEDAQRKVESGEAYAALQDQNPHVTDDQIRELIDGAFGRAGKSLWEDAQRIAEASGRQLPIETVFAPGQDAKLIKAPDFNALFYIKKALDGRIDAGFKAGGKDAHIAAGLKTIRDQLDARMRQVLPDYDQVQHGYWFSKQLSRAIEAGRKIAGTETSLQDSKFLYRDLVDAPEVRTKAEKEAIRDMIRSAHLDEVMLKLDKTKEGHQMAGRYFVGVGPEQEGKLRLLFRSTKDFEEFLRTQKDLEQAIERTRSLAGGNSSTIKQGADAITPSGQVLQAAGAGGTGGMIASGMNMAANKLFGDLDRLAAAKTAQQMMRPDVTNFVRERVAADQAAIEAAKKRVRFRTGILPALVSPIAREVPN